MKSIVYSYQYLESTIDFDSHITQLLFTSGCNFRCVYCHNTALQEEQDETKSMEELEEILKYARDNWRDAICVTGGEPTIHPQLYELLLYIKEKGFKVKLDTNGSNPDVLKKLLPIIDYIALDFKISLQRYSEICRVSFNIGTIRESLDLIRAGAGDYEIRTTVIPGIHDREVLTSICREIRGVKRYVLQPFVPKEELLDADYIRVRRADTNLLQQSRDLCESLLPGTEVKVRI